MANIEIILYIALSLIIISSEAIVFDIPIDEKDIKRCQDLSEEDSITTNTCTSINSSLKSKQGKCCKFTINMDTLERFKSTYSDNWRKIGAEQYGFDENLPEEEIRELYIKNEKKNLCSMMIGNEEFDNYVLYGTSLFSIGRKITYDCGDGKKSYNGKNYNPKNKQLKELKDLFECQVQTNKTNCFNAASKFLTNDILACWNKVNKVSKNLETQIENVAKDIEEMNIKVSLLVYSKNIKVKMEILKRPGDVVIKVETK
jgi:hypothetical protein